MVIIGDTMTKLQNDRKMEKRIEFSCKIYVKRLCGAMVLCMEENMKTYLRKPPHHFSMHVEANDLSSEKSSTEIAELIQNIAFRLKKRINCY